MLGHEYGGGGEQWEVVFDELLRGDETEREGEG